jgi:predicted kinase
VIDKDVLKTALLEAGVSDELAGPAAYESFFALASHFLGQGVSVVLDSPSFWESIPARGNAIASERMVSYYFIETICEDSQELLRRLQQRQRLRSNPGAEAINAVWVTVAPPGAYLRIDTTQPVEHCLALALDYLEVAEP